MYWLPRRKDFKMADWKAKCKCKQPHTAHNPVAPYMGPGCNGFYSDFACIACDCRWEDHSTLWEFEDERRAQGKKVGQDYLPLNMNKELHDLVFHTDRKALPNYNRPAPTGNALTSGAKQASKSIGPAPKTSAIMGGGGINNYPVSKPGLGGKPSYPPVQYNDYDDARSPKDYQDDRYLDPNQHQDYLQEKQYFQYQVGRKPVGVQDAPISQSKNYSANSPIGTTKIVGQVGGPKPGPPQISNSKPAPQTGPSFGSSGFGNQQAQNYRRKF